MRSVFKPHRERPTTGVEPLGVRRASSFLGQLRGYKAKARLREVQGSAWVWQRRGAGTVQKFDEVHECINDVE